MGSSKYRIDYSKAGGISQRVQCQLVNFTIYSSILMFTVQTVFFCIMGIMVMRMKFLWSPYMCVLAPMLVADEELWTYINYTKYISTRKNKKSVSSLYLITQNLSYIYFLDSRHIFTQ